MRSRTLLITTILLGASNIPANAISWSTQMNCASDYYAYCSKHVAGSAGCHACMRANRPRLKNACVSALIDDGIIPKSDITQQKQKTAVATANAAPPDKFLKRRPIPKLASTVARTAPTARLQSVARAKRPQTAPPQQSVQTEFAIDQQTFEALRNRAPYFVATVEIEAAEANTSPRPSLGSR